MKIKDPRLISLLVREPLRKENGQLFFVASANGSHEQVLDSGFNKLKTYLKNWPSVYYFLLYFTSTIFFGGLSVKKMLKKLFPHGDLSDKIIINLGSGPRKYCADIINVDLFQFKNVDIVSDIMDLPFQDGSIDLIIVESLLEHVQDSRSAVEEMRRVLKPGGHVYALVPFLYPFHSSPNDFHRWTKAGIIAEFVNFGAVDVGMRSGPITAILSVLMHALATMFSLGSEKLYLFFVNFFMVILAPFKLLDFVFFYLPHSIEAASFIYYLGKKNG
jgi:SAM-dependent methyltransferase